MKKGICDGCLICGEYGCNMRRKKAKNRISVDKLTLMECIGSGGGSLPYPQTVEIPEVCAREWAKGLGWTLSEFIKKMN